MSKSPNPVDIHVGSRVRMRRLMLDFSQTRLADALGLTFQQVQKYEKGANRISASRLQQIAHALQVPIPFFFEGLPDPTNESKKTPNTPSPTSVSEFLASPDGMSLTKAFMETKKPKLRHRIVQLVEQVAGQFPPT